MASLRHPILGNFNSLENEYSVVYLFAPIQSFTQIKNVTSKFEGHHFSLKNRRLHFNNSFKEYTFKNNVQNDYISFTDSIPEAVEYRFSKDDSSLTRKQKYFSFGGPIGFIGKKSGKLYYEIGWEFALNPFQMLSVLPSINYSFDKKENRYLNYGLRIYSMGYNAGILCNERKKLDYSLGISFGVLGIEFRSKTFIVQFSL